MTDIVNKYFNELSLILFYIAFFGLSEMYVESAKLNKRQKVLYYLSLLLIATCLIFLHP